MHNLQLIRNKQKVFFCLMRFGLAPVNLCTCVNVCNLLHWFTHYYILWPILYVKIIFYRREHYIFQCFLCNFLWIGSVNRNRNRKCNKRIVFVTYAIWNFWLLCLTVQWWLVFKPAEKQEEDKNSTDIPWHHFLWVSNKSNKNITKNNISKYESCLPCRSGILCKEYGKFMCAKFDLIQLSSLSSRGVREGFQHAKNY